MIFAPLYKQSRNRDSIEFWKISTKNNTYTVEWGVLNGTMQTKTTVVESGKNLGKKNETSATEQAEADALSKWEKKKLKGYVDNIENVDAKINPTEPMLATPWNNIKIKPVSGYVQEKLNGIRCVFNLETGKLWTRGNKEINSLPHILNWSRDNAPYCLDGELMWPGHSFQDLCSVVKRDDIDPRHTQIQYHLYDIPISDKTFTERLAILKSLSGLPAFIKIVETIEFKEFNEARKLFDKIALDGGEGIILRVPEGKYKFGGRSKELIKYKNFEDNEYEIVGGEADKDGHCVFICKMDSGLEFSVTPEGSHEQKAQYLVDLPNLIGKMLNVRHVGYTADGKPFHAVGVYIREIG